MSANTKHRLRVRRVAVRTLSVAVFVLTALCVVAGLILLRTWAGSLSVPNLLRTVGIVREEERQASGSVLTEARKLYTLDTGMIVYELVFPYDFMDERLDIEGIVASVNAGRGTVSSLLTPTEELFLRAYNLAHDVGMRTGPDRFDFIVVTVIARAGFQLTGNEGEPWARIDPQNPKRIAVRVPRARITELRVEDPHSGTYPYPDFRVPPRGWSRISRFVLKHAEERIRASGVLQRAQTRAEDLLTDSLRRSGFDIVSIVH